MKNFIISLLIFIPFALLGIWWYNSCDICKTEKFAVHSIEEETNIQQKKINDFDTEIKEPVTKPKNISKVIASDFINITNSNGDILFKFSNKLKIFKNSDSLFIDKSLLKFKDSLHNYLNRNQNQELLISGWQNNEEDKEKTTDFGLQRANKLKESLIKFGLNSDKINTSSKLVNYDYDNNEFKGGVNLSFREISKEKYKKINKGIKQKTLYTKFNSRKFIPDNTILTYTYDLKNYLQNHPNENVIITGHTDDVGEDLDNIVIARDRARNVMNHFINNGIEKSKIEVVSKGEREPIADNKTKKGRAKNRRIEIIVN